MPVYRMTVTIEYAAKRTDSGDQANAIMQRIKNELEFDAVVDDDPDVEEVDTPTQPDEDGT